MSRTPKAPPLLPVEFGRRDDGKPWISFGPAGDERRTILWPGTIREAGDVAQALNAAGLAAQALRAARDDARDPDTDTALSAATGDLIDEALLALGGIR